MIQLKIKMTIEKSTRVFSIKINLHILYYWALLSFFVSSVVVVYLFVYWFWYRYVYVYALRACEIAYVPHRFRIKYHLWQNTQAIPENEWLEKERSHFKCDKNYNIWNQRKYTKPEKRPTNIQWILFYIFFIVISSYIAF